MLIAPRDYGAGEFIHLLLGKLHTSALQGVRETGRELARGRVIQIELAVTRLAIRLGQGGEHGLVILFEFDVGIFGAGMVHADFDLNFVLVRAALEGLHAGRGGKDFGQGGADLFDVGLRGEPDRHDHTALELNAVLRPSLHGQTDKAGDAEHQRRDDEGPLVAEKIEIGFFK